MLIALKNPLYRLMLITLCFLLAGIYIAKINSAPVYIIFSFTYGAFAKKYVADCRALGGFYYAISNFVVILFAAIIIGLIDYSSDIAIKEYINSVK